MKNEPIFKVGDKVMCVYPEITRFGSRSSDIKQLDTFIVSGIIKNSDGVLLQTVRGTYYYSSRFLNLSRVNRDEYTQQQIKFINNILKNFPELMATEFIEFDKTGMFKIRGE